MQISISLCLGANLRSGGAPFSPASLFSDGDGALIQRRSDAFFVENTASTHAVDTNAVGFATDGSEGAGYAGGAFTGLGAERVTNGDFSSDDLSMWTPFSSDSPLEIVSGEARSTATMSDGDSGRNYQIIPTVVGRWYIATIRMRAGSGRAFAYLGWSENGTHYGIKDTSSTVMQEYTFTFKALTSSTYFGVRADGPANGKDAYFDDVSVREIPGAHITQATTSYKPTLQTGGLLFDGNDDRLTGLPAPATSGTLAARFNGTAASKVILGSQAASDGRCFLALDASGAIAAGIGAQGTSTITGGSDIRSGWHTAAVTWDGSTVTLYLDGVSVYSAAQSGAVNTTVAMMLGALNANGTAAAFWAGTVSDALVIDRVLTTDEITNLNSYWSA